jgi:DNA-binding protein HU-beta
VLQGKVVIVISAPLRERGARTIRVLTRAALKCLTSQRKTIFISVELHTRRVLVNKSGLVDRVASAASVDKRTAEAAVDAIVDSIMECARSGERVTIFGFGSFSQSSRAARLGRNPRTGEAVPIAASTSVKFAPATAFKAALNPRSTKKAAGKKAAGKKSAARKPAAKKVAAKKTAKSSKKR